MRIGLVLGGALITAALSGGAAAAQPAPECARAKMPSEKAICADPEIAEIDAAMSRAYAALKASLPTEQQPGCSPTSGTGSGIATRCAATNRGAISSSVCATRPKLASAS